VLCKNRRRLEVFPPRLRIKDTSLKGTVLEMVLYIPFTSIILSHHVLNVKFIGQIISRTASWRPKFMAPRLFASPKNRSIRFPLIAPPVSAAI